MIIVKAQGLDMSTDLCIGIRRMTDAQILDSIRCSSLSENKLGYIRHILSFSQAEFEQLTQEQMIDDVGNGMGWKTSACVFLYYVKDVVTSYMPIEQVSG